MKMKLVFNSLDIIAIIKELQSIQGSRVNQIYDIDNKTYLFKLNQPNSEKIVLLIESGVRLHLTKCNWPKKSTPSGFTMKLRKHINNKRITYIRQLGNDRIIDMQFGSGEVAFHVILELYSRGNIILTDYQFTMISMLRSFVGGESNFAVHEKYPVSRAKTNKGISADDIREVIISSKKNLSIKKSLLPFVDFGSSLLEHALIKAGFDPETKLKSFSEEEIKNLEKEFIIAENILKDIGNHSSQGYIIYDKDENEYSHMLEFNPSLFVQHEKYENRCFTTFNEAVDEYYSKLESQKVELKMLGQEKDVMKKVDKIRNDQSSRLEELSIKQQCNKRKAELIMSNASTVHQAINILRSAIATQMSWNSIKDLVDEATRWNDPVVSHISALKLQTNQICMRLSDPFAESKEEEECMEVDLDLSLSAFANAKRYYDGKKHAALKEQKTLESQKKAVKSAEKRARETLKIIKTQFIISKTRKVYWFEKFYWFISSENYLIIGGRDQKQNEVIVKKYMKAGDIYVHADIGGASNVIIKNPSGKPVPPRTLDEAGLMVICYSNAWSSTILFNAWWVHHYQVSKTTPSGENLATGNFMIIGEKNYILTQHLQMGFSFLFKVDDSSVHRHENERKSKISEDDFLISSHQMNISDGNSTESNIQPSYLENDAPRILADNQETNLKDNPESSQIGDELGFSSIQSSISGPSLLIACQKDADSIEHTLDGSLDNKRNDSSNSDKEEISDNFNPAVCDDDPIILTVNQETYFQDHPECSQIGDELGFSSNQSSISGGPSLIASEKEIINCDSTEHSLDESNNKINDSVNSIKDEISDNFNPAVCNSSYLDKKNYSKPKVKKESTSASFQKESELNVKGINAVGEKESHIKDSKYKRGQKSRQKKIKEKYKDQDEEEKQLRMSILKSAGSPKVPEKKNRKSAKKGGTQYMPKEKLSTNKEQSKVEKNDHGYTVKSGNAEKNEKLEEEDETLQETCDLDMINSLTGQPHEEDEIIFALPIVAPYSSVVNNKYKIKIIPGMTKRGKAARAALELFLRSKDSTSREKEVIKSVSDQLITRNFPGKVKVLLPHGKKK